MRDANSRERVHPTTSALGEPRVSELHATVCGLSYLLVLVAALKQNGCECSVKLILSSVRPVMVLQLPGWSTPLARCQRHCHFACCTPCLQPHSLPAAMTALASGLMEIVVGICQKGSTEYSSRDGGQTVACLRRKE
jgi:heterodisulfide reductase subunit B